MGGNSPCSGRAARASGRRRRGCSPPPRRPGWSTTWTGTAPGSSRPGGPESAQGAIFRGRCLGLLSLVLPTHPNWPRMTTHDVAKAQMLCRRIFQAVGCTRSGKMHATVLDALQAPYLKGMPPFSSKRCVPGVLRRGHRTPPENLGIFWTNPASRETHKDREGEGRLRGRCQGKGLLELRGLAGQLLLQLHRVHHHMGHVLRIRGLDLQACARASAAVGKGSPKTHPGDRKGRNSLAQVAPVGTTTNSRCITPGFRVTPLARNS